MSGWIRRSISAVVILFGISASAFAQIAAVGPWTPVNPNGGTVPLSVSSTTANVALATSAIPGGSPAPLAYVCNIGTVTGYVTLGVGNVVATAANGYPVLPSNCYLLNAFQKTALAAITASSTTTLLIASGSGNPSANTDTKAWQPADATGGSVALSLTTSTANVALESPAAPQSLVCNTGTNTGYVTFGPKSNTVATVAAGFPVLPNACYNFNTKAMAYIAGITGSSTTTLTIASGSGNAFALIPGGAVGSGTGVPAGAVGSLQTNAGGGNFGSVAANFYAAAGANSDITSLTGLTTPLTPGSIGGGGANHAALIDVAGVNAWRVIPDCPTTGGTQALNFLQSTDAFSCNAVSGGGGGGTVNSGTGPAIAQYLAGTGTVVGPSTLSGDATIAQGGALTVANSAITNAKIANATIDLTAKVTGILPGANGGSGNGFFAVAGPTTSLKTFNFPNASANVLTDNAAVTVAQGGSGRATLTANAILLGNGTSQVGLLSEVDGNCVVGAAGVWTAGSCGGASSVSVTASTPNVLISPSPGTATFTVGTTNAQNTPTDGGSHSYTVLAGDATKEVVLVSTFTAAAVPQATSSFGAGYETILLNRGAITATSTTSTINGIAGATGIKLGAHQFSEWASDGTNWDVALGVPQPATQTGSTFLRDDMTWAAAGGSISGLTTNVIPKAASSTTIADSKASESGSLFTLNYSTGTATPPAPAANTLLEIVGPNGVNPISALYSYGGQNIVRLLRSDGTIVSPTAVQNGDVLGGYALGGYDGTAISGSTAIFNAAAAQNFAVNAHGSYAAISTTPNGTAATAEVIRFEQDAGVTVPGSVTGGDKGAGTINAAGLFVNGVAVGGGGMFGYSDNGLTLTAATRFVPVFGSGTPSTTENDYATKSPSATTVTNLQVNLSADPGSGQSLAVTLRKNGADTALTCTITGPLTPPAAVCQDITHSVNLAQNDLIDWKVVTTGTYVSTPSLTILANNGTSSVGLTNITLGPGLAKTIGTQNPGTDAITTTGTINKQLFPVTKATSYSVVAADTGNDLIATGAAVVFTLPNPASGTKGTTFQFGSDGTNGFSLATVGATATFYGCTPVVAAGATTLTVELNVDVQVIDDGTNYKCTTLGTRTISYSLTYAPGINPNNLPIANFKAGRIITGIRCTPEVAAGGAATISVVKAASGTAISAGTALHSGSCNANGTAATDQDLTVTVTSLAAGDRLGITATGTTIWTSSGVAAGVVTVFVR